jgi:hypothetical protein
LGIEASLELGIGVDKLELPNCELAPIRDIEDYVRTACQADLNILYILPPATGSAK